MDLKENKNTISVGELVIDKKNHDIYIRNEDGEYIKIVTDDLHPVREAIISEMELIPRELLLEIKDELIEYFVYKDNIVGRVCRPKQIKEIINDIYDKFDLYFDKKEGI